MTSCEVQVADLSSDQIMLLHRFQSVGRGQGFARTLSTNPAYMLGVPLAFPSPPLVEFKVGICIPADMLGVGVGPTEG